MIILRFKIYNHILFNNSHHSYLIHYFISSNLNIYMKNYINLFFSLHFPSFLIVASRIILILVLTYPLYSRIRISHLINYLFFFFSLSKSIRNNKSFQIFHLSRFFLFPPTHFQLIQPFIIRWLKQFSDQSILFSSPYLDILQQVLYLAKFGATSDDWKILLNFFIQPLQEEFAKTMKLIVPSDTTLSDISMLGLLSYYKIQNTLLNRINSFYSSI